MNFSSRLEEILTLPLFKNPGGLAGGLVWGSLGSHFCLLWVCFFCFLRVWVCFFVFFGFGFAFIPSLVALDLLLGFASFNVGWRFSFI